MRICIVGTEIVPSQGGAFTGGLVNNTIRLAQGLFENGHQITIITSDVNNNLQGKHYTYNGIIIIPIRIHFRYGSFINNIEFLLKIIPKIISEQNKSDFEIIHFHSGYSIFGIIPALLKLFLDVPFFFTLYSPIQITPLRDRKGMYQLFSSVFLSKILISNAGKITVLSKNILSSLKKIGLDNNFIEYTPPIVDSRVFNLDLSKDRCKNKLKLGNDLFIILYCGNWATWKGVDLLISAVAQLIQNHKNIKLILAWGEPYNWYDEEKCKISNAIQNLNLTEYVIELGIIKDINFLMAACDVFVAPFRNTDGVADQPLSILEAMSCGKPIIATSVGGIPEIIFNKHNGILIAPNNVEEIRHALKYLIEHQNEAKIMGINGSCFISENNSINYLARKFAKLYQEEISNYYRH